MKKITKFAEIRKGIIPALILISLLIMSCSNMNNPSNTQSTNTTTGTQGANDVFIQNMAFSPTSLTVTSGTTVTWTNKDGMIHTVTSDSTLFDSKNIQVNGVFSYTFNKTGTFSYHCSIHPSMKATITVNAYVAPSGY